jgi:hypothetical protein
LPLVVELLLQVEEQKKVLQDARRMLESAQALEK